MVLQSHNGLWVVCAFGNLYGFSSENEAWSYSTVYQSMWLRFEDAWKKRELGWGGSAVFPWAKGSAENHYNSLPLLPCIKLLSKDLDHLSCYLPHPCFSITQNSSSCFQRRAAFMNKIKRSPVIKRHSLKQLYRRKLCEFFWNLIFSLFFIV